MSLSPRVDYILIIRNDITKVKADAIVNTANPRPYYAAGTDSAIYEAAGAEALLRARKKIGDIAPGQAAVTKAFALNARYIIHTVGPLWRDGEHAERETLRSCYALAMDMRRTDSGDTLAYCRKWVAFQERFQEIEPVIPIYSN